MVVKMNSKHKRAPMIEVGEANFDLEVLKSEQPVLVAFWAPWSHPCQILDLTLNEVAAACARRVKVVRVNADNNPDLGFWYEVESIPTLLYFFKGNLRSRIVGTASKEAILAKLQAAFPGKDSEPVAPIEINNEHHNP